MDEQTYQPPTLVELGEFSEDTLGSGPPVQPDSTSYGYGFQ
jgi:hypothetical protein